MYALSKKKKNITFFHLKITVFRAVKNCSILHRRGFIMVYRNRLFVYFDISHKGLEGLKFALIELVPAYCFYLYHF